MAVQTVEHKTKRRLVGHLWAEVGGYQLSGSLFPEAINYEQGVINMDLIRESFKKHYFGLNVAAKDVVIKAQVRDENGVIEIETFIQEYATKKPGTKKVKRSKVLAKRRKK